MQKGAHDVAYLAVEGLLMVQAVFHATHVWADALSAAGLSPPREGEVALDGLAFAVVSSRTGFPPGAAS